MRGTPIRRSRRSRSTTASAGSPPSCSPSTRETATGHPPISNEEVAASCADARRHPDPVRQRRPVEGPTLRCARPADWSTSTAFAASSSIRRCRRSLPATAMAYPLYEVIEELGVPALFHTGQTGIGAGMPGGGGIRLKYSNPLELDDVAADFPALQIILAHPSFPWQDEALAVATHKPQRLHRSVGLVAEVLPAATGAVRQHVAEAQGALRLRLPGHHPGSLARRLRGARHQAGGTAADPQGQRGSVARTRRKADPPCATRVLGRGRRDAPA